MNITSLYSFASSFYKLAQEEPVPAWVTKFNTDGLHSYSEGQTAYGIGAALVTSASLTPAQQQLVQKLRLRVVRNFSMVHSMIEGDARTYAVQAKARSLGKPTNFISGSIAGGERDDYVDKANGILYHRLAVDFNSIQLSEVTPAPQPATPSPPVKSAPATPAAAPVSPPVKSAPATSPRPISSAPTYTSTEDEDYEDMARARKRFEQDPFFNQNRDNRFKDVAEEAEAGWQELDRRRKR